MTLHHFIRLDSVAQDVRVFFIMLTDPRNVMSEVRREYDRLVLLSTETQNALHASPKIKGIAPAAAYIRKARTNECRVRFWS